MPGGGLYSGIGSYFNSDCNPNTVRINLGRKMFLVTSRNIKKGEEVTDNYCAVYSELGYGNRKHFLKVNIQVLDRDVWYFQSIVSVLSFYFLCLFVCLLFANLIPHLMERGKSKR